MVKKPTRGMFKEAFKAGAVKKTTRRKGAAAGRKQAIAIAFSKARRKKRR